MGVTNERVEKFPSSRVATIDVCEMGRRRHHVSALLELDVTSAREKIREYKRKTGRISFTSWLIHTIAKTIKEHEAVASYLVRNRSTLLFENINVSTVVEKVLEGTRVPIPMVVEGANDKSIETIFAEIEQAKNRVLTPQDWVLQRKRVPLETIYPYFPGFVRRWFWKFIHRNPRLSYRLMGNVFVTSVGSMGRVNGWFIPTTIHPVCLGVGSVTKKPRVLENRIEIREILHMTVLIDHDVVDGAQMARFVSRLVSSIEEGDGLNH